MLNLSENFRQFAKNLFSTFLGLLMALGLGQWRERSHDRQAAHEALEAVHEEMSRNVAQMEKGCRRCKESQTSLDAMVAHVDALILARRKGAALPAAPELGPTGTGWLVTSDAWTALKSMGLLRNLSPTTVRALSHAYGVGDSLDRTLRLHPSMTQPMNGVFRVLREPGRLAAMDVPRLEATRDELRDFEDFFVNADREMAQVRQVFLEAREVH
jgi:hypothetical protein